MAEQSPNRGYNIPERNEYDWDILLNENFEDLDSDVQQALDGSGGGGGGDSTSVDGIANAPQHVGPMRQGSYHDSVDYGVAFWAEAGLTIESAVIDTDLTGLSTTTMPVILTEHNNNAGDPPEIGRTTVTVSGGPERVDLSGLPPIPSDGEYVLARGRSSNTEVIPARRIPSGDFGTAGYDEHTYDRIDFLRGRAISNDNSDLGDTLYYYFFDIAIGPSADRVTSPWSTDVDEIYMRPTDPEEEFDDVSPRALWFDTS